MFINFKFDLNFNIVFNIEKDEYYKNIKIYKFSFITFKKLDKSISKFLLFNYDFKIFNCIIIY